MKFKKNIKQGNHSTTDWDILQSHDWTPWLDWDLSDRIYVSPPKCFFIDPENYAYDIYALCNLAASLDLKNGRLQTFHRRASSGIGRTYAYIGVTGPGSTGIRINIPSPTTRWELTRITWWQGKNPAFEDKTLLLHDIWDTDHWETLPLEYHPPMTGNVNRVGLGCTRQSLGRNHFFDDTIIWRKI